MSVLSCTACNLAIAASRYGLEDWKAVEEVLPIMEKWSGKDRITVAAWRSVRAFVKTLQGPSDAWNQLSLMLDSKHLMAKKPLSLKKQLALLSHVNDTDQRYAITNFLAAALLQKSQWLNPLSELSPDVVQLIRKHIALLMNHTWTRPLAATILLSAPEMACIKTIPKDIIPLLVRLGLEDNSTAEILLTYGANQPTEIIQELVSAVDESNELAARLLAKMLDNVKEVPGSDLTQYRVLVHYMDFTDLKQLVVRLVQMAYSKDPRENQRFEGC
ncbi:hypothetical protein BX666DRAFT_245814 [Dichotomocladium elegans]|nr:hypothetical protein BX666DRAFT_245814 [Dichotomocladium elegans]